MNVCSINNPYAHVESDDCVNAAVINVPEPSSPQFVGNCKSPAREQSEEMGDPDNGASASNSKDEGVEDFTNDPLLETPKKPKQRRGRPRKGENVLPPKSIITLVVVSRSPRQLLQQLLPLLLNSRLMIND